MIKNLLIQMNKISGQLHSSNEPETDRDCGGVFGQPEGETLRRKRDHG